MLKLNKLCSVILCLVCTGLVALPTVQAQIIDGPGGVNLNGEGYLYNVPDLQPDELGLGFTNALLADYVINLGQLVGHYADGVAITNALDLLPYVGQSLDVTDADGNTMVSLSETGIYLYDEVLMEFVPITVTNGQLYSNGDAVGGPSPFQALALIDESEAESEVIVTVNAGVLNIDGSPVNTDDQVLSATGLLISLEDGGSVNLSNAVTMLAAEQAIADTDDQLLSLSGTTLSITDGNSVDLGTIFATEEELNAIAAPSNFRLITWSDQFVGFSAYLGEPAGQGFTLIDNGGDPSGIVTRDGRQTLRLNDNDTGIAQINNDLTSQTFAEIHERGGVFSMDLEIDDVNGVTIAIRFDATRDFLEATTLTSGATLASQLPASTSNRGKQYALGLSSNGGNLRLFDADQLSETFAGGANGLPALSFDTRVRIEVVIENGFQNDAEVYLIPLEGAESGTRYFLGTTEFKNNEGSAPADGAARINITSGSLIETGRISYVTSVGLQIYDMESTTYTLTAADMALDRIRIVTPATPQDFQVVFPVHADTISYNRDLRLEIVAANTGAVILSNADALMPSFFNNLSPDAYAIINTFGMRVTQSSDNSAVMRTNFDLGE